MSVFRPETLICPVCGHRNTETVALSLHGSRVPEIVASIVDGTFQCFTCNRCDLPYRADGPLIYIDFERKRWIGEFPASMEPDWAALEQQPLDAFRRSVIDLAPTFLRAEADGFAIRAVFGLEALAEKIRLFDAGLDDRIVEVAKLQTMLRAGAVFAPSTRPRVVALSPRAITLGLWVNADDTTDGPVQRVSAMIDAADLELLASEPAWRRLLSELSVGPYVDLGRLFLDGRRSAFDVPFPDMSAVSR